jgi:hypothetical protein
MAEQPNDASRKSKAEGDRRVPEGEPASDHRNSQSTDERSGITNRSMGEESASQQAVPSRGQSRSGADSDRDMDQDLDVDVESRRNER